MIPRPSSRKTRVSSSSSLYPIAIKPPSRTNKGGSATIAASNRSINSACPCNAAKDWVIKIGASSIWMDWAMNSACVSPVRMLAKSRGPARSSEMRDNARSKSGTLRSASRNFVATSPRSNISCTASKRDRINARSNDGDDNRRSNNRAPDAVTVRSTAPNKDPLRPPPVKDCVISRLRRVAASICITRVANSFTGQAKRGNLPFCVMSR